jgi:hypothetical protein
LAQDQRFELVVQKRCARRWSDIAAGRASGHWWRKSLNASKLRRRPHPLRARAPVISSRHHLWRGGIMVPVLRIGLTRMPDYAEVGEELERLRSTRLGRMQLWLYRHLPSRVLDVWDLLDGTARREAEKERIRDEPHGKQ